MNEEAFELWKRALKSLETAEKIMDSDPDAAVSRAYYAAFYAVSALFAIKGATTFSKHSAVETAVHRDLVKAGIWPTDRGVEYTLLRELREKGDYGILEHISTADANKAIDAAKNIINQVHTQNPEFHL